MLKAIEVENYRSFSKPAKLELRPITILMGRNSAGKSSLTRLFPLFRQSLARDTSAPVLWTSTTIDFGRIGDVINRSSDSDILRISFDLDTSGLHQSSPRRRRLTNIAAALEGRRVRFNALLSPTSDGKTDYRSFSVEIDNDTISVQLKDGNFSRLYVNSQRVETSKFTKIIEAFTSRLFPYLYYRNSSDAGLEISPDTNARIADLLQFFTDSPLEIESSQSRTKVSVSSRSIEARRPIDNLVSREQLYSYLTSLPDVKEVALSNQAKFDELYTLILLTHFGEVLSYVQELVAPVFESSSYLGPIRSSGSRFYREQELSVDRIDEKGENFATYIGSLNSLELGSFNQLLSSLFNVRIRSHSTVGHISLEIAVGDSDSYDNLADVGFGFSQLLPLVAQIHSQSRRAYIPFDERGNQQIIAIEQPELHLHPAFQARLADLFVNALKVANPNTRLPYFVLETHSETMIARLGELVVEGLIDPGAIVIHFLEKDDDNGASSIRVGEFDSDGIIQNWPLGFFSARSI